jgi:hypothetical protein
MTEDIPAAELDAIVAQLVEAGLVEVYTNEEGHEAYRLTAKGEPVARAVAMAGDEGTRSWMRCSMTPRTADRWRPSSSGCSWRY